MYKEEIVFLGVLIVVVLLVGREELWCVNLGFTEDLFGYIC